MKDMKFAQKVPHHSTIGFGIRMEKYVDIVEKLRRLNDD